MFHVQGSARAHSFLAPLIQYLIFFENNAFMWRAISGGLCSSTPIPDASMVTWRSVKIITPSKNLNSWRPVELIPVIAKGRVGSRRLDVGATGRFYTKIRSDGLTFPRHAGTGRLQDIPAARDLARPI